MLCITVLFLLFVEMGMEVNTLWCYVYPLLWQLVARHYDPSDFPL